MNAEGERGSILGEREALKASHPAVGILLGGLIGALLLQWSARMVTRQELW